MPPNYPIASVDRALRLLLYVSQKLSVRLSEAAEFLDVSQSGAHRLFDMLKHYDFVEQDSRTREYRTGPALIDVGLAAIKMFDLRAETHPYLEQLCQELEETVHLLVLRGPDSIFLDVAEPALRALRSSSRIGVKLPAYTTSGGKALLAQLSSESLRSLYPDEQLPRLTDRTVNSRSDLERELTEIRERGYAVNLGESEPEIGGVGVALIDRIDRCHGALVVTAPLSRLTPGSVSRFGEAAMAAAERWREGVPSVLRT